MNLGEFDIGDAPAVVYRSFNDAGDLADGSTVKVVTRSNGGTETAYTYPHANLTRTSTGVYKFTFPQFAAGTQGTWYVRFNSSGAGVVTSTEDQLTVRQSAYTTPLP